MEYNFKEKPYEQPNRIYQGSDGQTQIEVRFEDDTLWLPLQQISELFQRDKSVISRHIKNNYKEGELAREATVAKNATVQTEGKRTVEREVEFYNLDLIISVGYRVNSKQGTQFRIWPPSDLKITSSKATPSMKKEWHKNNRNSKRLRTALGS